MVCFLANLRFGENERRAVVAMGLKHFDGSERAPKPGTKDIIRGMVSEFLAMMLFVYFGCGSAARNAGDPAWVLTVSLQFGLAITVRCPFSMARPPAD